LHAHEIVLKEARTMAQQAARDGDDGGLFVAGRAELRPITIGRDYGSRVEVVSGLQPSDEVILDPADSLTSGTAVRVQEQSASSR
jgi:multidrug efflux pump subunit AcrA (membrane-fusion protein)